MSVKIATMTLTPSPPPLSRAERGDDWCKCVVVHLHRL
jgi:hypothetical protein